GFDSQMNENELHDCHLNKSKVFESASDSIVNEIEEENNQVNNMFKKVEGYHAVPSPYIGNYMLSRPNLSFARLYDSVYKTNESDSDDDYVIRPSIEQNKPSYAKINFVKSDENTKKSVIEQHTNRQAKNLRKSQSYMVDKSDWNGMMDQKLGDGFEFNKKACFVCGSLNHLIKDCNFYENKLVEKSVGRVIGEREVRTVWNNAMRVNHQNKLTHPDPKRNFVPTAVATKPGQVLVNAAKQSSPRAVASISTARHVNTAAPRPKVNDKLPTNYSYFKVHSPVRRPFNQKSAAKTNNFNEKVNTTEVNNATTAGPKAVVNTAEGKKENNVKSSACWIWIPTGKVIDHIFKDSGSYMLKRFDYVDPQGRLNGCSRHMTRNKSFLTDYQEIDEGFIAFAGSPKGGKITSKGKIKTGKLDFEDVYFVKELNFAEVPRQDNMYSFDLKNIVSSGGLTYLFAKATIDESNLWHRRLGHINFKNMNKLVRGNLVRGLPSKIFENDHSCVACQKGKQHKASCKTKLNRVLVTKPHNKTPYELLLGRPPSISFMRPFRCLVTILNTLDPLGKFDGKADEGFLIGYSINSKAFRVFNTKTRKVEENLHIKFLKNKPNVARSGPACLFDIDSQTKSMNYEPVTAGNQTNSDAGMETNVNTGQIGQEKASHHEYILLPLLFDSPQSLMDAVVNNAGKKTTKEPTNEGERKGQEKEGGASNKEDSTISPSVSTDGPSINTASANINIGSLNINTASPIPNDSSMQSLEATGIYDGAYDDEDVGAEDDLNNLETTMNVSPTPPTRIHKDHPKDQIIRDINSATQTRRMTKTSEEHALVEPKKVIQALDDPRWIEVIQEELLQFKLQTDRSNHVIFVLCIIYGVYCVQDGYEKCLFYGTIKEEMYVYQPPGFEDPQFPNKVYKVEKALYGLHQAPKAWFETLFTYLFKMDLEEVLIRLCSSRKTKVISYDAQEIPGEFYRGAHLLLRTATSTPIETNKALLKDEEAEDVDVHLYRSMIGSLMYLTTSRPDIMFVVCACARFQCTPKISHLHAVERIFRYLKGQPKLGLWYPRDSPFDLEAFSNSDYARASIDRKSTKMLVNILQKVDFMAMVKSRL
ncbi:putative ribonuclease H-like domain-containing protein, partial [Tanacetum coccineum]